MQMHTLTLSRVSRNHILHVASFTSSVPLPGKPLPSNPSHLFHAILHSLTSSMSVEYQSDVNHDVAQLAPYRPAVPIPDHIREHCHIYLDEQIYSSALTLLSDLVVAGGASNRHLEGQPTYAPVPLHLELVSCLLVHPRYTSQAPPNDRLDLPSKAVDFLRNTLAILGPVNARFDESFSFSQGISRSSRRNRNPIDVEDGASCSDSEEGFERMKGLLANSGRLSRCATDFWHAVGWALNCSVRHPKRWRYWKVWLSFILDVLHADWEERERLDKEDPDYLSRKQLNSDSKCEFTRLKKCILLNYLDDAQGRSSTVKRVIRSVFADGCPDSLKEFPEVFTNETKEVRHTGQKRKRGDRFGDFDDEDEDFVHEESDFVDQPSDLDEIQSSSTEQDPWLGGSESLVLRQRLICLLSRAAYCLPDSFIHLNELYDILFPSVKILPLPAFLIFMSPSYESAFSTEFSVSFFQTVLVNLLPNSAPSTYSVTRQTDDTLSQIILEKCMLPFSAMTSSVPDNARVSILIESLLRLFLKACEYEISTSLIDAIEKGVKAREDKIKGDRRRKDNGTKTKGDESDMIWLKASGERLRMLVGFLQKKQEEARSKRGRPSG